MTGHNGPQVACGVLFVGALSGTSGQRSGTQANMANERCEIPGVVFWVFKRENRPRRKSYWKCALKRWSMDICGTKLQGKQEASSWSSEIDQENDRCNCGRLLGLFLAQLPSGAPSGLQKSVVWEKEPTRRFFRAPVVGMSHP